MLGAKAKEWSEKAQALEDQSKALRDEVADAKGATARVERQVRDLKVSLAKEKDRATRQEESATKVALLEGRS